MILFCIMGIGILIYYVIRALTHSEGDHHVISGRYYDDFPTMKHADSNPDYPEPTENKAAERAEEEARQERREQEQREIDESIRIFNEEWASIVREYDKDHFYDVTNRRWVKRMDDGTYTESEYWLNWNVHGRRDSNRQVDVGELITRKEYERRTNYTYREKDDDD